MVIKKNIIEPSIRVCLKAVLIIICFFSISLVHARDWIYTVHEGDNLWNLTVDYLIDISYVKKIQKINNIADPWHILPGTQIRIPAEWIRQFPSLIRVQHIQGTAKVLQQGLGQPQLLSVGEIVVIDDTIITDADSTLIIGFLDGSRIMLEQNSRLKIDHLMLLENTGMSDTRLHLEAGRLETLAATSKGSARRFEIKTPATVTSVRGTDYRVSAEKEKNESRTEVTMGQVDVQGANENLLLPAGFGTVTLKDQDPMPPIRLFPPPDINQLPQVFTQFPIQFVLPEPEDGQGYRVQIALSTLFQEVIFDKTFYSNTIKGPNLADGSYHIRIRAIDKHGLEGYNSHAHFSINVLPESPFLITPKPGKGILVDDSFEFIWAHSQKVTKYHLQISKDQHFTQLLIDKEGLGEAELKLSEELVPGKYYWRVAATDNDGDGPFSEGRLFRRILPAPEIELSDNTENTIVIRSRRGLPGQTYHFQVAKDAEFNELLVDLRTDNPGIDFAKPDGGEYFIRIRTIDQDSFIGPFGAAQSFSVPYNYYWLLMLLPLLALIAL